MYCEYVALPDRGSLQSPFEELLAQDAMPAFHSEREILQAGAAFLVG